MRTHRWAVVLLLGLMMMAPLQVLYYYPQLPEQVTSHFNAAGQADDYLSRGAFISIDLVLTFLLGGLFLFLGWLPPKIPPDLVSLPYKDYWLAPERREATWERVALYSLLLGILTVLGKLLLSNAIYRINAGHLPPVLPHLWLGVLVYLALVTVASVHLHLDFRKVPLAVKKGRAPGQRSSGGSPTPRK